MEVYRIAHSSYCEDLSGRGAELHGGRWNRIGTPAVYTSSNRALCALEILANLNNFPNGISYSLVTIQLPDIPDYPKILPKDLPNNWNDIFGRDHCIKLGDEWLYKRSSLAMAVPSSLVMEEFNILINPFHHDAEKIFIKEIREFAFDPRFGRNDK